jgi:hypothetical protein
MHLNEAMEEHVMLNPFDNKNTNDRKVNVADLFTGAKLLGLLNILAEAKLMEWNTEQQLAKVAKVELTRFCEDTQEAQGARAWLTSQGFKGSRRSRSYYLSLRDLEARGVTITAEGKAEVCEPKVAQATGGKSGGGFASLMAQLTEG